MTNFDVFADLINKVLKQESEAMVKMFNYNKTKMTTFRTLKGNTIKNKTKFTHEISSDGLVGDIKLQPEDWDNVIYIGYCLEFEGDVFLVSDEDSPNNYLYVGVAGDEFK